MIEESSNTIPLWAKQDLPPMLSRRFEFENYAETRRFLDGVAKLAEEVGLHPSLSFGKTYVSVTIDADGKRISPTCLALAQKIDGLVAASN